MWLALGIGVSLTVVGEAVATPLVRLFGAEGAIETNALIYLRISLLGVPAMLVTLAGTGYLRGRQDTRTPLLVSIGSSCVASRKPYRLFGVSVLRNARAG